MLNLNTADAATLLRELTPDDVALYGPVFDRPFSLESTEEVVNRVAANDR